MTLRPGVDVAWVLDDAIDDSSDPEAQEGPTVVVVRLPDHEPVALRGTAAAIWLAAVDAVDEAQVVAAVAADLGVPDDVSGPDTRAFLADLLARGLLARE